MFDAKLDYVSAQLNCDIGLYAGGEKQKKKEEKVVEEAAIEEEEIEEEEVEKELTVRNIKFRS